MKKIVTKLSILLFIMCHIATANAQWVAQTSGTTNDLNNVRFIDNNTGWVVGDKGTILKSTNGGADWTDQTIGLPVNLYALSLVNSTTGYASGDLFRNLKTTNGGITWNGISYSITNTVKSIHSFSAANVVGVGNNVIFRTTNSFSNVTTWGSFGIQNCLFYVASTGWTVGNTGRIYKLTGAISFTNQISGTTEDLLGVHFISTSIGYIVGKNGTMLKTTNGGTNWMSLNSGTTTNLYSVFFTDANTGYAVGDNETIIKTIDGGISWTGQMNGINSAQQLRFIWFTDANNGWIVGTNGAIYHTTNGGEATVGMASTPSGPNSRCETPTIYSSSAVNATSYLWSLQPTSSGTITGNEATATVTWNSSYTGNTTITARGINGSDQGSVSNPLIVYGNPSAFSLLSPDNGAWVSTTPLFQWANSTGAIFYQLYIDGILFKDNITSTSYQVLADEAIASGMHTWYVVANNGCTIQSNETRSFRVDSAPPSSFNLFSPDDDSWTINLKPTLEWSASSDAHSGLAKYQLWIDGILNKDNIPISVTSTTPITALSNGSHTWEVKAIDNVGNIRNSSEIRTVKVDNTPPGFENKYLVLNGSNQSAVSIDNSISMGPIKTIEAWIYVKTGSLGIVACCNGSLRLDNSNKLEYFLWNNQVSPIRKYSNSSLSYNTWHHIAVVHNHINGTLKMYIDGVLDVTHTNYYPYQAAPCSGYIQIGSAWNNNSTGYFKGFIDEVRIWNVELSQETLNAEYHRSIEGVCNSDLLGCWRFNDMEGSIFLDESVNNITLSSNNNPYLENSDQIIGKGLCDLVLPTCSRFLQTTTPQFIWRQPIDAGIGTEKYQLIIDDIIVLDNISDTNLTLSTHLSYGKHAWYVKGYDFLGNNQTSYRRTFYIDNAPPNQFNLTSPVNNEIVMFPTPNLSWEAATDSTGGSGMRKYQLWINGAIDRDSIPIGVTTTSPSTALPQGVYTWFVRAYDNTGNFRQSTETRTFYIDWEPPTDFALILPVDNATVNSSRPDFEWEESFDIGSGLDKYELNISGQTPIEINATETTHALSFDLPNGNYTWFVKAYDLAGAFTSSNIHNLTTYVPLPSLPETPVGDDELCINPPNTEFSTAGATNAISYIWDISPENAGTINGDGLTATVEWTINYTGIAQIKVKGVNSAGEGEFSSPLTVTISPETVAGFVTGNAEVCLGSSINTLTLLDHTGSVVKWQKKLNNDSWNDISNTSNTYSEIPTSEGIWEYRVEVQSGACQVLFSTSATITVVNVPTNAEAIIGPTTNCQGESSVNYTTTEITYANSYVWTLPAGAIGTSSTNSITVNYTETAVSGEISVKGVNDCGEGEASTLFVQVNALPSQPSPISGNSNPMIGSSYVYTVENIEGVNYEWNITGGL